MDVLELQKAIDTRAWPIVAAIVIGAIVRFSKTEMAGNLFEKVPRHARVYVPLLLGILSGVGEALLQGVPWTTAIFFGVIAGMLPIGGHEVINAPSKKAKS